MKTIIPLFVLIAALAIHSQAHAQARRFTDRVVNRDNTLRTPNAPATPPAPPVTQAPAAVTPPATPAPILTNAVPEKTKEQKAEILRKTIEFQKKKAEEGAPTAQYDLGMRYLNGDGVEKDMDLAKKWLNASATNGNSQAVKKLESLNKK